MWGGEGGGRPYLAAVAAARVEGRKPVHRRQRDSHREDEEEKAEAWGECSGSGEGYSEERRSSRARPGTYRGALESFLPPSAQAHSPRADKPHLYPIHGYIVVWEAVGG